MRSLETIVERLKTRINKPEIMATANEMVANNIDFKPLFKLMLANNTLAMRAAWLVENITIPNKSTRIEHFEDLANVYLNTESSSVRRNIGKTIAHSEVPKNWEDSLYSFSTALLANSNEDVAVKVHAMAIATNIAIRYPELLPELKATIEDQIHRNSVAYKGAYKRISKKFKKVAY